MAKLSYVSDIINPVVESDAPIELEPAEPANPAPNNPPWGSAAAVGVWIFSVAMIVILPGIFLAPYALSFRSVYTDSGELIRALAADPVAIAIQIAAVIPAHLLTIGLAWMVVTQWRRFSFTEMLGWRAGGMRWWHYVVILFVFFCLAAAFSHFMPEQENELMRILRSSRYVVFLVAFMATFTAPLVEEVVYRGILYSAVQRSAGVGFAIAIVTFLFAVVHLPQYYPSISTMIMLTLLSLILTLVRAKTNNLLPCVILHTIFNGFQAALLILEPYLNFEKAASEIAAAVVVIFK